MSARWVGRSEGMISASHSDWAGTFIVLDKGSDAPVDLAALLDDVRETVPHVAPAATRVRVSFSRSLKGDRLFAAAKVIARG